MKNFRVGIVGLGTMGSNHLRVLRALPNVEVVGVVDQPGNPRLAAAQVPVFDSVANLISAGLDACVVATPTTLHKEVAIELAKSSIPTLVEKPLSSTSAEGLVLISEFDATRTLGCVGHIERHNPAMVQLKAKLEEGAIGAPLQFSTSRQSPYSGRISDVGVITDLGTHDIHSTLWVSGSNYASFSVEVNDFTGNGHEDFAVVAGRLATGALVSHVVNWMAPFKDRRFVVLGEEGALIADTLTGDLYLHKSGSVRNDWDTVANFRGVSEGDLIRFSYNKVEPLQAELRGFISAVRTSDLSGVVTLSEGQTVLELAERFLANGSSGSKTPGRAE